MSCVPRKRARRCHFSATSRFPVWLKSSSISRRTRALFSSDTASAPFSFPSPVVAQPLLLNLYDIRRLLRQLRPDGPFSGTGNIARVGYRVGCTDARKLEQFVLGGVRRSCCSGAEIQLRQYARDVPVDGVFAEREPVRDVLVAHPLRH